MKKAERTFEDHEAQRETLPLLVGLFGASSSGKTYSALRLATGMQHVVGGDIFVIDTESKRALHYADSFQFRHVPFGPPFSPLDYMAAIEHCCKRGAKTLIVDSASHEHEGPGGLLEWHEKELDRLAGNARDMRNKMTFSAWAEPKAARRRLINTILQLGVNAIFCFRAKPKLKIRTGLDPLDLGWMPISGEEWVYEMTVNALLYPGSGGIPTWNPELPGERQMVKLPTQFADVFAEPRPLDEAIGEELAKWAAGGSVPQKIEKKDRPSASSIDTREALVKAVNAAAKRLDSQVKVEEALKAELEKRGLESTRGLDPEVYADLCRWVANLS